MALVGGIQAELTPAGKRQTLAGNYLDFNSGSGATFAQQYLPELYEAEVEIYGNRTVGGFLKMVGAEMPMKSDQVIWSEQTRLHVSYDNCTIHADGNKIVINTDDPAKASVIKKHQTIVVKGTAGVLKALVTDAGTGGGTTTITALPYTQADFLAGAVTFTASDPVVVFVYGSDLGKASDDKDMTSITPDFVTYSNSPIVIRDRYEINGSDVAQIGWVEVETEGGQSGFLWYLKAESETRLRYDDYLEMTMIEAEKVSGTSTIDGTNHGTEGLFAAVKTRGHEVNGFDPTASGGSATSLLGDFDDILKQLDKEGSIEENMLFANRSLNLNFDDMLADLNSPHSTGTSFGVFNNSADMALNLGFSGFRRGSYDFYKTDWKYLNDASTRGLTDDIEGLLVPAGTSTVYDQSLGKNIRRPFLHVRYRASETEDRKFKSWTTGSVGAKTSSLDAMHIHFLSERCLCVQGANNFVLFTK